MPTTLGTNSKSRGSLQKGIHGKHKKHHVTQSKTNTGTSEATSATASLQLSALGLLGPSIVPISPNSWSLVRVYFGNLSPETVYKTVLVSPQTTAKDVVAMVLKSLPCLPKGTVAEDLSLQEVCNTKTFTHHWHTADIRMHIPCQYIAFTSMQCTLAIHVYTCSFPFLHPQNCFSLHLHALVVCRIAFPVSALSYTYRCRRALKDPTIVSLVTLNTLWSTRASGRIPPHGASGCHGDQKRLKRNRLECQPASHLPPV